MDQQQLINRPMEVPQSQQNIQQVDDSPAETAKETLTENMTDSSDLPRVERMDIVYYNAVLKLRETNGQNICYSSFKVHSLLIKLLLFGLFVWVHYSNNENQNLKRIFLWIAADAATNLLIRLWILSGTYKLGRVMNVARSVNHTAQQQIGEQMQPNSFEEHISQTYDYLRPEETGRMGTTNSDPYQPALVSAIQKNLAGCLACLAVPFDLLGGLVSLYLMYALFGVDLDRGAFIMALIWSLYKLQDQFKCISCLLCCCICSPFILCCCVACLVGCFKQLITGNRTSRKLPQIPTIKYDPSLQISNQCPICFQSYSIDDEVMILPCDNRHAFHKFCISQWLRISGTCPYCRKDLTVEP